MTVRARAEQPRVGESRRGLDIDAAVRGLGEWSLSEAAVGQVLLVEDDEVIGSALAEALGAARHRVQWCHDGRSALSQR